MLNVRNLAWNFQWRYVTSSLIITAKIQYLSQGNRLAVWELNMNRRPNYKLPKALLFLMSAAQIKEQIV